MPADAANEGPHPGLQKMRQKLHNILGSISTFRPSVAKPPIIDASITITGEPSDEQQHQDAIHGLRALRDAVQRDLDNIEKFFADSRCASLPMPSTNAPYLIAVWNEVLLAPPPVIGIWSTFSETGAVALPRRRGGRKDEGIRVDVVADGGKRWIRVNTIKNSKLLAEFRELDSYLTDSDDDFDDESSNVRPSLRQVEFDNSVLRMARPIVAAAKANPITGTSDTPTITMQLTRLDPNPVEKKEYDSRISRTTEELKAMGIDVQLGERDDAFLSRQKGAEQTSHRRLHPTSRINLDLSILIALVSDLTHSPLPRSIQEAESRFTPSASYIEWKKSRLAAQTPKSEVEGSNEQQFALVDHIAKPSRALSTQAMQETMRTLWEEMLERLTPAISDGTVDFWTTPEAVDRCMQIVGKIGGPNEKRRARAMLLMDGPLTVEEQEEIFWRGSRYKKGYIPLFPIHIFPLASRLQEVIEPPKPSSPFSTALFHTCRGILSQETDGGLSTVPSFPISTPDTHSSQARDDSQHTPSHDLEDGEIPRAPVMKANHRLTAHTVQTMLWGASKGWTILTANKTSVKAILKEMKASGNGLWDREEREETDCQGGGVEDAALWVVEPRSLAEGMRSDFNES
ncbi:hypothetical protein BXZ70DRAFT_1009396 [Cristinia sonorae]|uniref:DUF1308 domain-containing protein n=1 Tax=Cristinia sonorae TaxID=1940300 RepID=A0A8K0UN52_9AGAR|nr:hypothetical protein BXZ70DRAFT_1009396 [Cristinia sonorae]